MEVTSWSPVSTDPTFNINDREILRGTLVARGRWGSNSDLSPHEITRIATENGQSVWQPEAADVTRILSALDVLSRQSVNVLQKITTAPWTNGHFMTTLALLAACGIEDLLNFLEPMRDLQVYVMQITVALATLMASFLADAELLL